jgi:hypothetical protein
MASDEYKRRKQQVTDLADEVHADEWEGVGVSEVDTKLKQLAKSVTRAKNARTAYLGSKNKNLGYARAAQAQLIR